MTGKEISLGPTGETVRENVARYRKTAGLSFAELSRNLEAVGRPLAPLGLRRIETGSRRVDVDDLMALAVVLGVNPLALLMPQYSGHGIRREITGAGHVKTDVAWHWARFNLESMRAHEVEPPAITSTGLQQNAEPTTVPTNAERQRTRASYVGKRIRALEDGRVWVMTATGGHSVEPGDGHPPDREIESAVARVECLLGLALSDDEAWAAAEFDPAPPRLRELDGYDADDDEPDEAGTAREVLYRRSTFSPEAPLTRFLRPVQYDNG